ncbi:MAG TPA: GlsB/YeaQ/YmgE family stress response membrane protein [Solirubrobacterales bacterium]|nr:GlsB/YeaQ/YmgE family stress response membrane protein [Solirubrobacterales bacterium]
MPVDNLVVLVLVGLVAGFLASHVMAGHGYGILGDIVVGILGAFLGVFLAAKLGIAVSGLLGLIIVAFIGALILVLILRLLAGATRRGPAYGRRRFL